MSQTTPVSMTGFGASAFEVAGARYRVRVKTVNHRNLNLRMHLPPGFVAAEAPARKLLEMRLGRGGVDLAVELESAAEQEIEVEVSEKAAIKLMDALGKLATHLGAQMPGLDQVLRLGDIVRIKGPSVDDEAMTAGLLVGLEAALDAVCAMRLREGQALAEDLLARLDVLEELVNRFEEAAPLVQAAYEARLRKRLDEAMEKHGVALDEARLTTELVIFADKSDVTEETVRARSHIEGFRRLLGPLDEALRGKRLDFLAQELGREMNTIGSKCRDAGMAQDVVSAKVELERIREQVQNIA